MPNYVITESVGNRVERVNNYRDLEKHHPSSGREAGRDYRTIDGELEEVRVNNRAEPHVKKDFIIDPPTIPAPASGTIRALNDQWNTVQIIGDDGKVLAQSLHMARGSQPPDGSRIEYGQTMGRMGDVGSPGSIHAHVEAPAGVFERYINDITSGRIQSNGAAVSNNVDPMADGVLKHGERGDAVKALQVALNSAGIRDAQGQPLPTTGYYGDMTEAAVRQYQTQKGLEVDGKAGRDTLTALGIYPGQQQAPANATDRPQTPVNTPENPQTPANNTDRPQVPANNAESLPQQTQNDKPLISNPNHPDNRLYQQAVSNLEQLGPSGQFKSREELEKAAAAVAVDAKASGLGEINHISRTTAPSGQHFLVAVQGDPTSASSKNSYIDHGQAVNQTVEQSTKMAETLKPATQQAQQPSQDQQEQPRAAMGAR